MTDSDQGRRPVAEAAVLVAPGILFYGQPFGYGRLSERRLLKALATRAPTRHATG